MRAFPAARNLSLSLSLILPFSCDPSPSHFACTSYSVIPPALMHRTVASSRSLLRPSRLMNESRRVAASRQRDRARRDKWTRKDEEMTGKGVDGRDRQKRENGPLALSQTVPTGPGTNLDQEPRERSEKKGKGRVHDTLASSFFPTRECPLFTYSPPLFLSSSLLCCSHY